MNQEKIYQVFVSSTFKDLEQERQEVLAAVVESGNIPVGMEYFPSTNATPFEYIKTMLEKVDYYILVLAGKYGSIEPKSNLSYTELEYNYAQQLGIPTMVFLYKDISQLPMCANETDSTIIEKLRTFRKMVSKTLVKMWSDKKELKAQVLLSIPNTIKDNPRTGWVRADGTDTAIDDFNYNTIAYTTYVDDLDFWAINNDGKEFIPQDVTWKDIVIKLFPELQSFQNRYNILNILKQKCGEISSVDFAKVFLQLQKINLIRQEVLIYPGDGGDVYFCLTNKGKNIMLQLT